MKILVACEESQAVTKEFRKLGHEAYSCDIIECSGGHPEWHLQQDVTELLKEKWDMLQMIMKESVAALNSSMVASGLFSIKFAKTLCSLKLFSNSPWASLSGSLIRTGWSVITCS